MKKTRYVHKDGSASCLVIRAITVTDRERLQHRKGLWAIRPFTLSVCLQGSRRKAEHAVKGQVLKVQVFFPIAITAVLWYTKDV